ncbi:hypothetical protein [Pseudonocardia sp.]|uniref:hypothetical protein n=2 Tax=Pseudonocardia sp. TaxID=60912 RepID=UPI003D11ACAF
MRHPVKKAIIAALALGGAVLPTGTAFADEAPPSDAAQAVSAVGATGATAAASFLDAADGNGPVGADGTESEVPVPSYNWVDGPVSGLLDGPFD